MSRMKWVGLTGGMGTGKSTVAKMIREMGIPVLDADQLAREALSPGSSGAQQVVQSFGPDIVQSDGSIDRQALGRVVFADRDKLEKLEAIVHPITRELMAKEKLELEKSGVQLGFYDVPLLFEKNMNDLFAAIVVVTCSEAVQLQRILDRGSLSLDEAKARLHHQLSLAEKERRATHVLTNSGDLPTLKAQVLDLVTQLRG